MQATKTEQGFRLFPYCDNSLHELIALIDNLLEIGYSGTSEELLEIGIKDETKWSTINEFPNTVPYWILEKYLKEVDLNDIKTYFVGIAKNPDNIEMNKEELDNSECFVIPLCFTWLDQDRCYGFNQNNQVCFNSCILLKKDGSNLSIIFNDDCEQLLGYPDNRKERLKTTINSLKEGEMAYPPLDNVSLLDTLTLLLKPVAKYDLIKNNGKLGVFFWDLVKESLSCKHIPYVNYDKLKFLIDSLNQPNSKPEVISQVIETDLLRCIGSMNKNKFISDNSLIINWAWHNAAILVLKQFQHSAIEEVTKSTGADTELSRSLLKEINIVHKPYLSQAISVVSLIFKNTTPYCVSGLLSSISSAKESTSSKIETTVQLTEVLNRFCDKEEITYPDIPDGVLEEEYVAFVIDLLIAGLTVIRNRTGGVDLV